MSPARPMAMLRWFVTKYMWPQSLAWIGLAALVFHLFTPGLDRFASLSNRRKSGQEEAGSFGVLQVYRREPDGAWKLARSIWNRKTGGPDSYISLGN